MAITLTDLGLFFGGGEVGGVVKVIQRRSRGRKRFDEGEGVFKQGGGI